MEAKAGASAIGDEPFVIEWQVAHTRRANLSPSAGSPAQANVGIEQSATRKRLAILFN
jgi:hypothetical protein